MKVPLFDRMHSGRVVEGYRVERQLGAGGFGQVFLAWRDGGPYALKFLHLERVGDWGWRELLILMSHDFPHVVQLRGHFKWPEDKPEYLVLAMEYVPGVTLFQWARECNPSAREVVEKLLPLVRALGGVHAAGVLHRDLKGDNVLVREPDGQPVLVDFGAGAFPHAPPVTREGMAPGNLRYRAPESIAFLLRPVRERGERYEYGVKDEMYALGVLLYVLTTDVYPFDAPDDELLGEIMAGEASPPCEVDARVPRPLSELCMRLLAREPGARVRSAEELCALLEALLTQSQQEPRWDVPLCYDWTARDRTTEHVPELGDGTQVRWKRWMRQKPRRGPPPHSVSPVSARRRRLLPVGLGVVTGLVAVGLSLLPGPLSESSRGGTSPALLPRVRAAVSYLDAWLTGPVSGAGFVHEVAPPWKPLEAGLGAAPPRADTPVPVTTVTFGSRATRMKKKAPGSQAEKDKQGTPCTGANVLLAVAAAANMACPGAPVRPDSTPPSRQDSTTPARQGPPPQPCPPGAVETMTRQLGLEMNRKHSADMPGAKPGINLYLPVKEGSASVMLKGPWLLPPFDREVGMNVGPIALPHGTRLLGQLYLGEKLVHGRFTQAITPAGDTFAVCMELWDLDGHRGVDIRSDDSTPMVWPRVDVMTVERFE